MRKSTQFIPLLVRKPDSSVGVGKQCILCYARMGIALRKLHLNGIQSLEFGQVEKESELLVQFAPSSSDLELIFLVFA